jgi:hypothetical protein
MDVRGQAPTLDLAINAAGNAAHFVAAFIAFAANASIGNLEVEIGYDNTLGRQAREYFQQFVPEELGMIRPSREVRPSSVTGLAQAISSHSDGEGLYRAVEHYRVALGNWRPGSETLALSHLYMGMEALADVALKRELERTGISLQELALAWFVIGVQDKPMGKEEKAKFYSEVRRRLLFESDDECYKAARNSRVGFQHAFMPFDKVRELAKNATERTAQYLRKAVIKLGGVSEALQDSLLASPFDVPFESHALARYLRGKLEGRGEKLSEGDQEYPFFTWSSRIKTVVCDERGRYVITPEEQLTAHLGPGISFVPSSLEVWGPRMQ